MARIAILGAGDMGTALATPAARNGNDVRLCGTALDGEIVAALRAGRPHPRLGSVLPSGVRVFPADETGAALDGAEIAVVAVTSPAVRAVVGRFAAHLSAVQTVVTVAKGFDDRSGEIRTLPEVIAESTAAPVVAVGGPSKANEVALGLPTAVVFAGQAEAVDGCRAVLETDAYAIEASDDVVGVEVAAAMKNAYAIALGVADGLQARTEQPHHNLRAALFPRAVREMGMLAAAMGGRRETAFGAAGAGDLQVTLTAGRNRLLGERIGLGIAPPEALAGLAAAETTVEGYAAATMGHELARRAIRDGRAPEGGFPVLDALYAVLTAGADPLGALWGAVTGRPVAEAVAAGGG